MSQIYLTKLNPNAVKVAEDDNYRLAIIRDEDPESPREWSNLGTMVYWYRNYILGDFQPKCGPTEWRKDLAMEVDPSVERRIEYWENGNGWTILENKHGSKEALERCQRIVDSIIEQALEENVLMLPIAVYNHSGLTMWVGDRPHPFDAAGWDSGQVGWIYTTKKDIKEKMARPKPLKKGQINPDLAPIKYVTKKEWERAREILEDEVKTFDQYLTGDIYGFSLETVDGEELDSCWGFYGSDPEKNGMKDHIEEKYHYLFDKLEDQY